MAAARPRETSVRSSPRHSRDVTCGCQGFSFCLFEMHTLELISIYLYIIYILQDKNDRKDYLY